MVNQLNFVRASSSYCMCRQWHCLLSCMPTSLCNSGGACVILNIPLQRWIDVSKYVVITLKLFTRRRWQYLMLHCAVVALHNTALQWWQCVILHTCIIVTVSDTVRYNGGSAKHCAVQWWQCLKLYGTMVAVPYTVRYNGGSELHCTVHWWDSDSAWQSAQSVIVTVPDTVYCTIMTGPDTTVQ